MIIQDLINSYPEIKRRMKHYKSIGDWENYNKEKKVADYIRDNLLSKKESKRQLERDLAENVSDIINTINIREADFINNRLLLDYTFNDFNEVDFGYSHRSVWGKFFWQVDFLINAVYFKGYRLKEESTQSLFNDKENNDIYWTNYERDAVNNRSVNRLYGNENIFSIGGGMSSGFGVIFPFKKRQNNIVISATGNARIRTESLVSYGYQCGIEYHLENIGFGLYYKNSTFKTLDNDDIILSNKNPKFGRVNTSTSTRNSEGELVNEEIVYYRARNPNDFDNIVNFSSFEFSIFILLFN